MTFSLAGARNTTAAALILLFANGVARAQDASIEKLLNQLPPPEKLIKPPVQQALQQPDPAFKDPMGRQIIVEVLRQNYPQALVLSRKLTESYPRSSAAYCARGGLALALRQFAEASSSFHTAANIQPRSALAYWGLASVEGAQKHFEAAVPYLHRAAELQPKSFLPNYVLSICVGRLGHKEESLEYAKKATALAPSVIFTWIQLARGEKAIGHTEATLDAMAKAAEVSPDSAAMLAVVGYSYINLNRVSQAIPPLQRAARLAPGIISYNRSLVIA